jgi:hypothetical protein
MSVRALAAGLIAILANIAVPHVSFAADLGDDRYGASPYDDPRYADIYRHPSPRRFGTVDEDDDEDGDDGDDGDDGGYRDNRYSYDNNDNDHWRRSRDHYLAPMPHAPRFADQDLGYPDRCAPTWRVKNRLRNEGWRDFRDLSLNGNIAVMRAERRENGRPFILRLDRCSGHILSARPAPYRAFGYYEPRDRYDRAF